MTIDTHSETESHALNISIRGWIALLLVYSLCLATAVNIPINETFQSAVLLALGFYFGQKGNTP